MRMKYIDDLSYDQKHVFDHYTNLGYQYEQNIMKKVVSPEMFRNPMNDIPIRQLEKMVEFLVNQVKRIKLEYNFTLPKNSKLLN